MEQWKIAHYKMDLMNVLENLRQSAGKTTGKMRSDERYFADRLDRAAVEQEQGVELIIRARERITIQEVQEALALIDQGLFGICRACGREIDEKRVRVSPASRLCIACKAEEERREAALRQNGIISSCQWLGGLNSPGC